MDRLENMRSMIRMYSRQLSTCIDKGRLRSALQMPRRGDRMYAYGEIVQEACCSCFRGGIGDGSRMVVYGYGGEYWEVLPQMVFENAVKDAMVSCSGALDFVFKGDWVDKQQKIMQYGYDGVSVSPLELSASIVGFRNGVWDFGDIDSPVYHSFGDRLPLLSCLDYDYDVNAGCPSWCSFLSQMLSPVDVVKLQKYLGLGVIGRRLLGSRVEASLWLVGSGANGKSTILNIVRRVYGSWNVSECSLSQLLDRTPDARMRALYSIEGKVFNLCDEVDMRDISRGSDSFKKLCSGEPQNVRGIGKDIHVAYDIPFMIFSMNQIPQNRNMDAAFRRRIVRIDFRSTVREDDMDTSLSSRLSSELSGIRNWMIEGYRLLRRDGFRFSHVSDESLMEDNEQYFDLFAAHEGIRPVQHVGHNEKVQFVRYGELYSRYSEFCVKNLYPVSRSVYQDLKRLGYRSRRQAQGIFYEVYSDSPVPYAERV